MGQASTRKTGARARKSQASRHRPTLAELRSAQSAAAAAITREDELRRRVERAERAAAQPMWLRQAYALSVRERDEARAEAAAAKRAHEAANGRAEKMVSACRKAEASRAEALDAVRFLEGRAAELVKEREEALQAGALAQELARSNGYRKGYAAAACVDATGCTCPPSTEAATDGLHVASCPIWAEGSALHLEVGRVVVPAAELEVRRALARRGARSELPEVGSVPAPGVSRVEPGGCHVAGCSSAMCVHRACAMAYQGGSGFGCGLLRGHRGPCGATS